MELTDFSEMMVNIYQIIRRTFSALKMEATGFSEMLVNKYLPSIMVKNEAEIPVKKESEESGKRTKGKEIIYFCCDIYKLLQMGARYMFTYSNILF
jgi:hypothetical protein